MQPGDSQSGEWFQGWFQLQICNQYVYCFIFILKCITICSWVIKCITLVISAHSHFSAGNFPILCKSGTGRTSIWIFDGEDHHLLAIPCLQRCTRRNHNHTRVHLHHILHRWRALWSVGCTCCCYSGHRTQFTPNQYQSRSGDFSSQVDLWVQRKSSAWLLLFTSIKESTVHYYYNNVTTASLALFMHSQQWATQIFICILLPSTGIKSEAIMHYFPGSDPTLKSQIGEYDMC